jgi:hypothetical protein
MPTDRTITIATEADLFYVLNTQRKYTNDLGFIPRHGFQREIENGHILLLRHNAQSAGYLLWTSNHRGLLRVIQLACDPDLLRTYVGSALQTHLERAAIQFNCTTIRAKSAADVRYNVFAPALGMHPTAIYRPKNVRDRAIIEWTRNLIPPVTSHASLVVHAEPIDPSYFKRCDSTAPDFPAPRDPNQLTLDLSSPTTGDNEGSDGTQRTNADFHLLLP